MASLQQRCAEEAQASIQPDYFLCTGGASQLAAAMLREAARGVSKGEALEVDWIKGDSQPGGIDFVTAVSLLGLERYEDAVRSFIFEEPERAYAVFKSAANDTGWSGSLAQVLSSRQRDAEAIGAYRVGQRHGG